MKKIEVERKRWTKEEDEFIINHTIDESAEELDRTEKSVEIRQLRLKNNFLY